jgi:pyruvate dehydrogenase E1 component beta subunit
MTNIKYTYGTAILAGMEWLLKNREEVFVIGQGLWSPWYVGNSMTDLDKKFGVDRIVDTPVSEAAVTGLAVGAALVGKRPIVVHPRMDFMLYATDSIVNQAAKWRHMLGGTNHVPLTVRAIINRGGEQGAQHSQALQSWFAHIPGLKVVMPATVADARDLLIASVLDPNPVIFIDDRWLYDDEGHLDEVIPKSLEDIKPKLVIDGNDVTIVASSYCTKISILAEKKLSSIGVSASVFDLRLVSPIDFDGIAASVKHTGRLLVVDGGWGPCGVSAEVIASVANLVSPAHWKAAPARLTLPFAPAPTSTNLENEYYFREKEVIEAAKLLVGM